MPKVYIATQGVGSFLAGEVVTGLDESRVEELEKSGALVVETAEQAKLRKAAEEVAAEEAAAKEAKAKEAAAAVAKAEEDAAAKAEEDAAAKTAAAKTTTAAKK